ncbi:hypothetical protein ABZS66_14260 [Dactylosporangium sp. NPDC005572]|uniref:hypothetical protein n=1 Tax=Dactylosporangium sp. NPDC005572 TaxID=3156889 RepID=UPI0033B3B61D
MRLFYQGPDIVVTGEHFIILGPYPVRYRLDDVREPYIVQHGRNGRFRPAQEIRARYGNRDVRLFSTTNATTFGHVRRALIRALEHRAELRA